MKRAMFGFLAVAAILTLCSVAANGKTVAYWRYEVGPADTVVLRTPGVGGYNYSPDIKDVSGNGNHLSVWDQGGAGFTYRASVPAPTVPIEGTVNLLSVNNNNNWPASFTFSSASKPAGVDIEAWTPKQWTIEASFRAEYGGHRGIVGRDGRNVTGDGNLAILYYKINPENGVSVAFADVMGVWHEATSAANLVQPNSGKWYSMAATSDGNLLTLYLKDIAAGTGFIQVAQNDMTQSGSSDTSMTRGSENGGDWHAGGWSVGRGLWQGGHTDRPMGYIDEVRISDTALPVSHFLFGPTLTAWQPVPANYAKGAGTATGNGDEVAATLSWNTGMNAANLNEVNGAIIGHKLFISTDPNLPVAPLTASGAPTVTYPLMLQMDKTYYWRVDEVVADSNDIVGPVWTFTALKSVPAVTTQPVNVLLNAGQTAQFTVGAFSVSTPNYRWYKSADNANNTPADDTPMGAAGPNNQTLTIANAQTGNEAFYYCVVTNSGDGQDVSAPAALAVRRLVAHWTLDQADYIDGLYQDISGEGHHADPNNPAFVTGQLGEGVQVARLANQDPTTGSWATAGTWNPSQYSGQMTVSFWLNWAGPNGTWQTFISKRSGDWDTPNVMWQICTGNNDNNLNLESPAGTYINYVNGLADYIGQWIQVAITFDGTTGRIYVNGEQRVAANYMFASKTDAMFCLGGNSFDNGPREWMNGSLDDVRIFNYPISELDAAVMYTTGAPGKTACVQSVKPSANFDLNNDCIVNIEDFGLFAGQWLDCAIVPTCLP